jgi:hypothetical protein
LSVSVYTVRSRVFPGSCACRGNRAWPAFDDDTALARATLAPGLIAEVIDALGEEPVREPIVRALRPYREPDGTYRLENEWHVLVARARC